MKEIKKDKWYLKEFDEQINDEDITILKIIDSNHNIVADFATDKENYDDLKSIVLLMKSAPELLAKLEEIQEFFRYMRDNLDEFATKELNEIISKNEIIIQKAKGGMIKLADNKGD